LLIAAAMIFSTAAVTANTMNEQPSNNMFSKLGVDYTPQPQTKMVETTPCTLGARDTILFESFEADWVDDSDGDPAPPGWENHITDHTDTGSPSFLPHYWGQYATVDSYSPPAVPPDGEYQAMVQWSYNHQDEWLITPQLDFTNYENCEVTFWRYGHTGSTHEDHYYVKASPTGGFDQADFTDELWDASALPEGDNYYDTPYNLDLSIYDGHIIRLAWHNVDGPTNDGLWYGSCIDAVEVNGDPLQQCEPSIDVEKLVFNPKTGAWEDADTENEAIDLPYCTESQFKIIITNTGDCPLFDVTVTDIMSDSLEFLSANPEPDFFEYTPPEYHAEWYIEDMDETQQIEIIIDFHVASDDPCEIDPNYVIAEGNCLHGKNVSDDDWCYVHVKEKAREINRPFLQFLDSHPNLFPLLQKLLQQLELY
jgi:hypothetical protein